MKARTSVLLLLALLKLVDGTTHSQLPFTTAMRPERPVRRGRRASAKRARSACGVMFKMAAPYVAVSAGGERSEPGRSKGQLEANTNQGFLRPFD